MFLNFKVYFIQGHGILLVLLFSFSCAVCSVNLQREKCALETAITLQFGLEVEQFRVCKIDFLVNDEFDVKKFVSCGFVSRC